MKYKRLVVAGLVLILYGIYSFCSTTVVFYTLDPEINTVSFYINGDKKFEESLAYPDQSIKKRFFLLQNKAVFTVSYRGFTRKYTYNGDDGSYIYIGLKDPKFVIANASDTEKSIDIEQYIGEPGKWIHD